MAKAGSATGARPGHVIRSLVGGSAGNLIEWYDWLSYSTFSLYFSSTFFPSGDQTAQLMNTAAIFAVGYLMRPLGAILFGYYADRWGRRASLTASIVAMGVGSLAVAVTPGYSGIGVLAPVVLVLARLVQGLSVGGEYGTSATYLSEMAPLGRRGFFASFHYLTLLGGQLCAVLLLLLLQQLLLTPAELKAWGWRIPFVVGSAMALAALYLRRSIDETPSFQAEQKDKEGPFQALGRSWKSVLLVAGLSVGGTASVNTLTVYMPKFMVNTAHFSPMQSTIASAIILIVFMALQPLGGALSDRIGRRPMLLTFGVLGALSTVPVMEGVAHSGTLGGALAWVFVGLVIATGYSSVNALVKAELFPTRGRALGVGLPYAFVVALFGGSSEYIGLLAKSMGHEVWFHLYVSGCILVTLIAALFLKETRDQRLIVDIDEDKAEGAPAAPAPVAARA
jgi:MHS family alpha-ketoglutarate permease-like MFS transporter